MATRGTSATSDDIIAVLPFRVSGADVSLAYLGEGMVDLLAAKLTGEGGPRAVDPRVAVNAWRRAGGGERDDVTPEQALSVASRIGAGRLLLGTVVGNARLITISVTLQDVPGGRERGRAIVEGSPDTLPALVDALASRMLIFSAGEKNLLTARTTTSLPALRAFLDGTREYRQGHYARSIEHFYKAVSLDSSFALAGLYGFFACGYDLSGACAGRANLFDVAHAGASRLGPRDSILLRSLNPRYPETAFRSEQFVEADRAARQLGDRPDAWYVIGDFLTHYGGTIGIPDALARGATAFERAVALDSSFAPALEHLVQAAIIRQDTAAATRYGTLYLAQDSLSESAPSIRLQLATLSGNKAQRNRLVASIDTMPLLSQIYVIGVGIWTGSWSSDQDRALKAALARSGTTFERQVILQIWFKMSLNRGRPAEALQAYTALKKLDNAAARWADENQVWAALLWDADSVSGAHAAETLARAITGRLDSAVAGRNDQYRMMCAAGAWLASRGDNALATRAVERLRSPPMPGDTPLRKASNAECALMIDAILAVRTRAPNARAILAAYDSLRTLAPATVLMDAGNMVLARLFESIGDNRRAMVVASRRTFHPTAGYWPTSFLMEARNAVIVGERERAIAAYEHYLALRSGAEVSMRAEVDRVRVELARLKRAAA